MHTKSTATGRRGYLDGNAMARTAITKARITKIRNTLITGRIVHRNQGGWMREPGMYWIKYEFQDAGLLGGTIVAWEAVYWDGDFILMTGSDTDHDESDAIEWGPRIYPPDHKETELAD